LSESEAVRLFVERTRAVRLGFRLDQTNASAIAAVCRHLDGLPLAIELAAARMKVLSVDALLARMSNRLRLLSDGPRDLPARQQTIRDTIAWSYELLDPAAQRLFRRLAVFTGGWTLNSAQAVAGDAGGADPDVTSGVAALIDQSLVRRVEGEGEARFTMLETIREFGLERLTAEGEEDPIRKRHAAWFRDFAESTEPVLIGPEQGVGLARLDAEVNNLRTALTWAFDARELATAQRLARALTEFWELRGHFSEGRAWLERALVGMQPSPERAKALLEAGTLAIWQGELDRAHDLLTESLMLAREVDNEKGVAYALMMLGNEVGSRGVIERAVELQEQALAILRRLEDTWGLSGALFSLADSMLYRGDVDQATALQEELLAVSRQSGNKRGVAMALVRLGERALDRGEPQKASALLEEGLALAREVGDTVRVANALMALGMLATDEGHIARSAALMGDALEIAQKTGHRDGTLWTLERFAKTALAAGQAVQATRLCGAVEALREEVGIPRWPIDRGEHNRVITTLRTELGDKDFAAAWAAGRSLSWEQVTAEALRVAAALTVPRPSPVPATERYDAVTSPGSDLTRREQEVLRLLCDRLTDPEIAARLFLSPRTASNHVASILGKLGVANRRDAAALAARHNLV
jgi:DNA-binding CsgD family transcriptional regulator/tetratricopeptide (TPR) repeat protein